MFNVAHADPCTAPLPRGGQSFSGAARYIVDGDGLCIGPTDDPSSWVEVRIADFYAPELREPGGEAARRALAAIVAGRQLQCIAEHRSFDRIVAACHLGGVSLGDILRRAGVPEGGKGLR
jgi:micrococcal nuclease